MSYAQNFEDVILWRALKDVEQGRYLDIGANDPVTDSVSKLFHDQGWSGVHVEPLPFFAKRLREDRVDEEVLEVALSTKAGEMTFYDIGQTGLATGIPEFAEQHALDGFEKTALTVQVSTLSKVFQSFGKQDVHWMKIDVEGMERDVLRGWGRSTKRPWIVVVESTLPNSTIEAYQQWEDLLLRRGYDFVYFDGLSRFYVHEAHVERKSTFGPGPNYFDGFTLSERSIFNVPLAERLLAAEADAGELVSARARIEQCGKAIGDLEFRLAQSKSEREALTNAMNIHNEALADSIKQATLAAETREVAALQASNDARSELLEMKEILFAEREQAAEQLRTEQGRLETMLREERETAEAAAEQLRAEQARLETMLREECETAETAAEQLRAEQARLETMLREERETAEAAAEQAAEQLKVEQLRLETILREEREVSELNAAATQAQGDELALVRSELEQVQLDLGRSQAENLALRREQLRLRLSSDDRSTHFEQRFQEGGDPSIEGELEQREAVIRSQQATINGLTRDLSIIHGSTSWRLSTPVRVIGRGTRFVLRPFKTPVRAVLDFGLISVRRLPFLKRPVRLVGRIIPAVGRRLDRFAALRPPSAPATIVSGQAPALPTAGHSEVAEYQGVEQSPGRTVAEGVTPDAAVVIDRIASCGELVNLQGSSSGRRHCENIPLDQIKALVQAKAEEHTLA